MVTTTVLLNLLKAIQWLRQGKAKQSRRFLCGIIEVVDEQTDLLEENWLAYTL